MKKLRGIAVVLFSFAIGTLVSISCSYEKEDPGAPYSAQVLVLKESQRAEDASRFVVGTRNFSTLRSLPNLDGQYFNIIFGGELTITDVEGSQVSQPSFKGGSDPVLRYSIKDGTAVPRDYTSMAMISAFYQLEQVFINLESLLGFSADTFFAENGKISVLFEPSIVVKSGDTSGQVVMKLNAAYVPGQKQFVLFRRSAVEKVPIGVNLQVIAHEFGHAAFERSFFEDKFDECARFEKEFDIKGFNEGFADVLSWAVTGSADILRGSFNFPVIADSRRFSNLTYDYEDLFTEALPVEDRCTGGIYCIGSLFASGILKSHQLMSRSNAQVDRHRTMREVYAAMERTQNTMSQLPASILPAAQSSDCASTTVEPETLPIGPTVVGAFLHSFILNMPADTQPSLCTAMAENFGTAGFPAAARSGVCP